MARPSKRVRWRRRMDRLEEFAKMFLGADITALIIIYWWYVYRLWQSGQAAETRLFVGLMLLVYGRHVASCLLEAYRPPRRRWVFPVRIIE